ncbi:MAG: flagellar biosynthesis protein FliQ [Lachnospiraceae bacterium]|nr:flagellar biosynthesis protein FliQ [Lachnospiraceae bacterium]
MTIDDVVQICSRALYIICITAAPVLLVSLVVGLIVSIFQTVTSIQEQTLTFVPKVLAIFAAIIILGHWMLNNMVEYMIGLWSDFSIYIR